MLKVTCALRAGKFCPAADYVASCTSGLGWSSAYHWRMARTTVCSNLPGVASEARGEPRRARFETSANLLARMVESRRLHARMNWTIQSARILCGRVRHVVAVAGFELVRIPDT